MCMHGNSQNVTCSTQTTIQVDSVNWMIQLLNAKIVGHACSVDSQMLFSYQLLKVG